MTIHLDAPQVMETPQRLASVERPTGKHDVYPQLPVNRYFEQEISYWNSVYGEDNLDGLIYRSRQAQALTLVDALRLPVNSRVLEVGSGTGLLTRELARRHYLIDAVDAVPAMVQATRGRVNDDGVGDRVRTFQSDAHQLDLPDASFDLVIALGVIPWLHSPVCALAEMRRVLKRRGTLIVTSDNRVRLNHLLDPKMTPSLAPARKMTKRILHGFSEHAGTHTHLVRMYSPREFDAMIAAARLRKESGMTVGFGPFSFFGIPFVWRRAGIGLHRLLQRLAAAGVPVVRGTGNHYIVVARHE